MNNLSLYTIINLVNNKKYIGVTNNPYNRQRQHMKRWSRCIALNGAIKKYGKHNFRFKIIATGLNRKEANESEKHLIKTLETISPRGYNLTEGGEGGMATAESRLKISVSKIGKYPTSETRKRMGESQKGRILDLQTRNKIRIKALTRYSNPEFKRKHTESIKKAMARPDVKRNNLKEKQKRSLDPAYRKQFSEINKRRWADPIYRKKLIEAMKVSKERILSI